MVFPAWIADPGALGGRESPQQIGSQTQGAGSAESLHRDDPTFSDHWTVGAEDQGRGRLVIGLQAVDRQVAERLLAFQQQRFRPLDTFQQRHAAIVADIDADAQVDPGRVGIGVEGLGDPQDGIAGRQGDGGEKGRSISGAHGCTQSSGNWRESRIQYH